MRTRKQLAKATAVKSQEIDCLTPAAASLWTVENAPEGNAKLFAIDQRDGKEALQIAAGELVPGKSTVRIMLPGDASTNGDVWAKNRANYVSFLCRSNKAAEMTFHLMPARKVSWRISDGIFGPAGKLGASHPSRFSSLEQGALPRSPESESGRRRPRRIPRFRSPQSK